MKILKNGKPEASRPVIRFECRVCGCLFDAERHEYSTMNDYRNGYYHVARCPCCGKDVRNGELVRRRVE